MSSLIFRVRNRASKSVIKIFFLKTVLSVSFLNIFFIYMYMDLQNKYTSYIDMHLLNYMYKRKGKQNHQNSMSGRTRLFDAVVFDNVTPHKTAVERSVYCKGAHAWNKLPAGVRNLQTYDMFKNYQKHELLKITKALPLT